MHIPVLKEEVLKFLDPKPNQNFIDCTLGSGGHTLEILKRIKPKGKVLGIDRDETNINKLKEKNFENLILVRSNYLFLKEIVEKEKFKDISGIIFDLGMSSYHVDESGKGFSFQKNEPLDMRYSTSDDFLTAEEIINNWDEKDLGFIFKEYGEERFSKIIAERIVEKRKNEPIKDTFRLSEIILESIPKRFQNKKIHPATKVFQALRITVNQELENLKNVLPESINVLNKDGKIVVISFHSLEDRIVKHFFKNLQKENKLEILTKKPVMAGEDEIKNNPRSRSAKLRSVRLIK